MVPPTSKAQATAPTSNATEKGSYKSSDRAGHLSSRFHFRPIIVLADTPYNFINFAGQQQRAILGT